MRARWIWLPAFVLYGAFFLWYNGWHGPLTADEVDDYMSRFGAAEESDSARSAAARAFLESDDGREFYMVNLVRLHPDPVADPSTGEPRRAPEVLRDYTGWIMPALFRRAGHPAFAARAAGGYLEAWGVAPDPGWSFAGVIRYRSRRDLMEVATDPAFDPAHAYKLAAIASTYAFPGAPATFFLGPRVIVPTMLALVAALAHIAFARRTP